ncbi:MAG: ATP-binding protein [Pseudomonadota bacterium]
MPLRIEDLIGEDTAMRPDVSAAAALQACLADASITAVPVVFERTMLGIATRDDVLSAALRLGLDRFAKCSLSSLMSPPPLPVAADTPIGLVASQLADQDMNAHAKGIYVTRQGAYVGHVPASALLNALAEENAHRARQMHLAAGRLRLSASRLTDTRSTHARTLAALAHEIRTPLTAMLGHADLLHGHSGLDTEGRDQARLIAEASQALSTLLDHTLAAGQAGQDKLPIKPIPTRLKEVAEQLSQLWSPKAAAKGLRLQVEVARSGVERVMLDPVRVGQVLNNLLSNALKFTDAGEVRVSIATQGDGAETNLLCRVEDTGPGIREQDLGRLFRPFERLGEDPARNAGAGLGLHVCQSIAKALGGSLSYDARDGGGSVFTLAVPAMACAPRLAAETASTGRPVRGTFELGRVLVVEDHSASQALIHRTLTSAGWTIDLVETLQQARRRLAQVPYQATLCDIHLPDGSGESLARHVASAVGPNQAIPIIALTADSGPERQARCRAAGFACLIAKPFRPADLVTRLADQIAASNSGSQSQSLASA